MIHGVKGAPDILPEAVGRWQTLEATARRVLERYAYREIRTPIFERTDLFVRGIGEGTDIVDKEMYTFVDRGEETLTLRPEGTAPVVRAYLEHKLFADGGLVKVYYIGPMFRRERPQAGRFRQFHQIGAEAIGQENPAVDAELLALLAHLIEALGIRGAELHLNSIGDRACRPVYRRRLVDFLQGRSGQLCADCQARLARNPLRILDCKNPECQAATADAPRPADSLCPACAEHFQEVRNLLALLKVEHAINDRMVRGLDYYTRTTFEFVNPALGAQNALVGGGRYDGLAEELGGLPTPGIGFAAGMERLVTSMPPEPAADERARDGVYLATLGPEAYRCGLLLVQELRRRELRGAIDLEGRSLKSQMRVAHRDRYRFCLILGSDELQQGEVTLRDMQRGEQERVPMSQVVDRLVALAARGTEGR
jgi:histidyl-tRNA synthetase